ncbi:AraC family transcriptional regulator [Flavobacterium sp. ENC]|uniref:helix-turn-helix domain-containing protein n=1 Tax=Flavobacterium sp. ENC TaxID=2897330 RepID=UPI001E5D30F8|nr:AraC family transcriptional regulator [Flavobacterium sp. ENC]MCD0463902.1 AraC family transcriptional regulator [Flavobacterium sp. ENC]
MMNFPIIMGITSGAAFLLGFLLIAHFGKVNVTANRYLGLFVITLGLAMIEVPLFYQKIHLKHPALFEMIGLIRFLTAPFLYISILCFTSFEKKIKKKYVWHFLPFLIFCVFRFPFFVTGENFEFSDGTAKVVFFILKIALPLQTIIYWCLSFTRLQHHLKNIHTFTSSTEGINLFWLKSFLLVLLFILIAWFNLVFFNLDDFIQFTPFIYLFSVFFLAYFSLQQKEVFDFSKSELNDLSGIKTDKKEPPKRVSEDRLNELNQKLQILIEEKKIYLDNDLSLPKLAGNLNASCNETSFVINELYGDNFYNFINKYRIEKAKNLLLSEKYNQLNILGIAYESGFNSKTTFNTTFKKNTGFSPTEFVKLHSGAAEKEL